MDYNFLENSTDFFKDTNEYFDLRRKFKSIYVWIDMIVYPLITIISFFLYGAYDLFSLMSFGKAILAFREWLRYRYLANEISKWKETVLKAGGPFIATNDPEYHIYMYADGMQRLHDKVFKRCSKLPFKIKH